MTKEEKEICKRLWENMQKDSSPWVWSKERPGFVAKIDGLTLVLYLEGYADGGDSVCLTIGDGDTSKTIFVDFWSENILCKMLKFLNERDAAKLNGKKDCLTAKLSSLLA